MREITDSTMIQLHAAPHPETFFSINGTLLAAWSETSYRAITHIGRRLRRLMRRQ